MLQRIWSIVRPQNIGNAIQDIDLQAQKDLAASGGVMAHRNRIWIVLMTAAVCLLMVHYLKYSSNLYSLLGFIEKTFAVDNLVEDYRQHTFSKLMNYIWWSFWHYLAFIIIPFLVVKYWIKASLQDYGWGLGEVNQHKLEYLLLLSPIMIFAIIASFGDDFSRYYPFYKLASRSWFDFIAWEVLYILQFVAVEFFFRGFILNGLRVPFGSMAIAVMTLPYLMLHFPKLWPEATGAILFGFFLGILALRSRSIWGGVAVHAGLALTMDIAALLQTKGLPTQWWP